MDIWRLVSLYLVSMDSWFTNLTDIHIPTEVVKTVSLGKNFAIPFSLKNILKKQMISDFESNIHKINEKDRNDARLKFVICIKNFLNHKQNSELVLKTSYPELQNYRYFFEKQLGYIFYKSSQK